MSAPRRLGELAAHLGLELRGDPDTGIRGVCSLDPGKPDHLGFLANRRYREHLASTHAAAVILSARDAEAFAGNALIADDPYLAFARAAALFAPPPVQAGPRLHPSAVIADGARVADDARVGPHCVIGPGAVVASGTVLGPGCVVEADAAIGEASELVARVYIGRACVIGAHCRVQAGACIGGRGFGLARGPEGWEDVPQLGTVRIGDRVEIGCNTTIDRGAVDDTVIEDGAKLDNQIQVGHNVRIGAHTAIAACVGIAGSTTIGSNCMIGGGCGINGHIHIGDGVVVQGFTMVTHSLEGPGQYGSGWPVAPAREWLHQVRRLRKLPQLEARVAKLEGRARAQDDQGSKGQ